MNDNSSKVKKSNTSGSSNKQQQQQQSPQHPKTIYKFTELPFSYFICLIIRFLVGISATGYIHPDEYFQSPEITSTSIFNIKTFIPWEFDPVNPCRSIVIPIVNTGIPFTILTGVQNILSHLGYKGSIINGYTLLIFPRFFVVCLSFLLDYYTILICKKFNLSISKALSVLSSCWLIIIFHSRTFSNTVESLTVATLLTKVVLYDVPKRSSNHRSVPTLTWKDFFIGSIVAFGLFARFTFLFFALPIGFYFIYQLHYKLGFSLKFFTKIITVATGFLVATFIFVIVDSIYFGYLKVEFSEHVTIDGHSSNASSGVGQINLSDLLSSFYWPFSKESTPFHFYGSLTFTPINSFLYNLDPKNLALHGIHNRLTHLVVNFPMMVGPLVLILFVECINVSSQWFNNNNNISNNTSNSKSPSNKSNLNNTTTTAANNNNNNLPDTLPIKTRTLLLAVIVSGLFFLSLAPHQEARFLLPLFFPLAILSYRYFYLPTFSSKCLAMIWILFNMCITIFFGFAHQGGVIPSLIYLQKHLVVNNDISAITHSSLHSSEQQLNHPLPVNVIYFKTYMPPEHLMTIPLNSTKSVDGSIVTREINIIDQRGDLDSLTQMLNSIQDSEILIISPLKKILYQQYKGKTCQLIESFWPHLSTENPPDTIDEMRLYLFSCLDWVEQ